MDNSSVGCISLDHLAQELHAKDHVPRFVSRHGTKAAAKSREQSTGTISLQDTALAGQRHRSLDNHVIERYTLHQVCQVSWFLADTFSNLHKRIDQYIFQLRVHMLARNGQGIFQFLFINAQHLFEETGKEDRVPRLIDQLGGQENAHLFAGHGYHIRGQGVSDTRLALEESRQPIQAHLLLVLRHLLPLHAVTTEIDILRTPLLALPTVVEFTIGGQVYQALIDDMQNIVDRCLLQLRQRSAFQRRINGHVASLALSYRSSPRHCVARNAQTQSRWAFCSSPAIRGSKP